MARNVGRCEAYKSCRRKVKFIAPGNWCNKHWMMWWDYGLRGLILPYMSRERNRWLKETEQL